MNTAPFKFGTIVTKMHFVNREEEKMHLISNFKNSINTIILSPRRWGKSSLVKEAGRLCNDENIKFCFIDMLFVRSEEEFYTIYAKEVLKQTSSKIDEIISSSKEFFKQLIPKITFSADFQNEFSIGFDWNEIKKTEMRF
jgi:AAA+ ATPase superfamily predicted ATPase